MKSHFEITDGVFILIPTIMTDREQTHHDEWIYTGTIMWLWFGYVVEIKMRKK